MKSSEWKIEFILNTRSLRGKIEIEDLRSIISDRIPESLEAKSFQEIGYHLGWDYAVHQYPKVHFLSPYISWSDTIALKPGSHLILFGEKVSIDLAVVHGSTQNHLKKILTRPSSQKIHPSKVQADDEVYFSVSKITRPGEFVDPSIERLSQQLMPVPLEVLTPRKINL